MTHPSLGSSRRTLVGALGLGTLGTLGLATAAQAAAPAGLVVPPDALASGGCDLYLVADGITGDSQAERFPGAVELLALDWGVKATRTTTGAGSSAGRPVAGDVRLAAFSSSASPQLLRRLVTGRTVRSAVVHVVRAGESPVETMTLAFTDVVLTGYEVMSSAGLPVDVVSFAMGGVTETWTPQNPDGTPGTPVTVSWDLRSGRVA
ncbi:type VI secretion system tube protein Hcp [Phycicoccus sp. MAQZ13P-2]|uniref:Hcp family type VI secretion system effector n=1 Tax=Phycicoccus mangrovi TaxID=2840470 RepID=UPI001C00447E|nr:type VI secretion system tube protein Hcp [Phycicoccus mangrovi]MBT9258003.1 type VI secretion system tube protein Hcp [Phycicoccus mangrovi]MBT9275987.1 type VI secretion system tube protein Hcp [Phycicoccus mangrovi]